MPVLSIRARIRSASARNDAAGASAAAASAARPDVKPGRPLPAAIVAARPPGPASGAAARSATWSA
ncbi:hypothetical protein GCM10010421_33270 [Streptomyces glaucus]|uniref:Secreted protein n=1 Tax=Streptomyces glaucus TaxID=284029 RepID=A0ABN3JWY5_9ACTN